MTSKTGMILEEGINGFAMTFAYVVASVILSVFFVIMWVLTLWDWLKGNTSCGEY